MIFALDGCFDLLNPSSGRVRSISEVDITDVENSDHSGTSSTDRYSILRRSFAFYGRRFRRRLKAAGGGARSTFARTFGIKVKVNVKGNGQECPCHTGWASL